MSGYDVPAKNNVVPLAHSRQPHADGAEHDGEQRNFILSFEYNTLGQPILILTMQLLLLALLLLLSAGMLYLLLTFKRSTEGSSTAIEPLMAAQQQHFAAIATAIRDEFRINRQELQEVAQANREELARQIIAFRAEQQELFTRLQARQKEQFSDLETRQQGLVVQTAEQLERIRVTVDEKLEKTLAERLGQSFETVGRHLIEVQKGLGEMQTLAQDVGGLKKVLANVKMRGSIGEVQLSMLLEQILAVEQYAANVKTHPESGDFVEFAIKLPGAAEGTEPVWLPIDAKFPKDVYEELQDAYEQGTPETIESARKNLDATIRKMASDISRKYIAPPHTTNFAVMFLPFEGIYAEVVRKASLLDELQRVHHVIVSGPTTLAAMLNSLQVGFRTLAIQQRSSEVWKTLGAVKTEFERFAGMMQKAQKNIKTGLKQLDDVMGRRTNAIRRTLQNVETLGNTEASRMLPELAEVDPDGNEDAGDDG